MSNQGNIKSYFTTLNEINVNEHTENKGGLTYLSWAWAWRELKAHFPKSYYTIYENDYGWNYHTDGRYCWVKTGVTVVDDDLEIEHIEYLPVMDYKNHSITADRVTSFDVNKTIQRSLTTAVARHGLGLYIYAGEDVPDEADGKAEDRRSVTAGETKKNIQEEQAARESMDEQINEKELKDLQKYIEVKGVDVKAITDHYKVADLSALSKAQYGQIVRHLMSK